ncbi:MAG: hypothetical protein PHN37_00450 [Candidatus Pacebacteria bacterium]|nr:hypothetical protein [Candidatus Paceibacterota bacterium]
MKRLYPLISIVLFLLIIFLIIYFWYPTYQKYEEKKQELKLTEQVVERSEEILRELKETETGLIEYKNLLAKLGIALPTESLALDLNVFLRQASRRYGLLLTSLNITEETDKVNISLSLSGSYKEFISFLEFLHKNYKLFKVGNISFTSPGETETAWAFTVNLVTYYLPGISSSTGAKITFEEIY